MSKIFTIFFMSTALLTMTSTFVSAETPTETPRETPQIKTLGVHHVGLAVKDLTTTADFFINALNFTQVDERPDYPAIFVSDGTTLITLWQVTDGETATPFSRKNNIGLHHMAFKLASFEDLDAMHDKIKDWPGVKVQFSPENVGDGPAKHMMFYEPGGIRLEFIVAPE